MSSYRTVRSALTLALLAVTAFITTLTYAQQPSPQMSFFITSVGSRPRRQPRRAAGGRRALRHAGEAGGCRGSADLASLPEHSSRSAGGERPRPHRYGPWYNAKGVMIAKSAEDLHSDKNNLTKETQLTEKGTIVNGRGDTPNMHDILTGSGLDGRAPAGGGDTSCNNWTSDGAGSAMVGHHDRQGGGANPSSWNSAHASKGCSQENLIGTGGNGFFYCFAGN